ncbi:MAG: hypothetical protein K6U11_04530 [bacterium]|nr:hypothetical protein [bacterium]
MSKTNNDDLIFDFWAHNPTWDEMIKMWGDAVPVVWGEPLTTGENARDVTAHTIACLYALRRDKIKAQQYARAINDEKWRADAFKFIENPTVFDPIKGLIPLAEEQS